MNINKDRQTRYQPGDTLVSPSIDKQFTVFRGDTAIKRHIKGTEKIETYYKIGERLTAHRPLVWTTSYHRARELACRSFILKRARRDEVPIIYHGTTYKMEVKQNYEKTGEVDPLRGPSRVDDIEILDIKECL